MKAKLVTPSCHFQLRTRNSIRGFVHPSVRPSVRPSIRPSVGRTVRPSVRPSGVIELKRGKTSIFDTFCVCVSIGGGLGCGWGLDAPAHPSATIL